MLFSVLTSIPSVVLNNGLAMPSLGFGTNTLNGDIGTRCVSDAISVGYRLIDTANILNSGITDDHRYTDATFV